MPKLEIPRHDWTAFLQNFSRKHCGWLVRMETCRALFSVDVHARDIALASITVEPKRPDGTEIVIMLSGAGGLTHSVERPAAIELEENDEGADEALAIHSDDGSRTVLRLGASPLPERVDGMAK